MLYHLSVVKKQNDLNVIRYVFLIAPNKFIERLLMVSINNESKFMKIAAKLVIFRDVHFNFKE